jgi:HD-GYP domain-containing protein (c-di-GMP phosphodiesterase class II)
MLRSRKRDAGELWREVVEAAAAGTYAERLDAVLAVLGERTGLPSRHLYLADEGSRRIHLERSVVVGRAATVTTDQEGGAEAAGPSPQAELPRTDEERAQRVVRTAAGPMLATPLVVGDRYVGALLAGPVDESVPGGVREAATEVAEPAAFVVEAARREETQRRELADLRTRLDTGRRLQGSALELDAFVALLLDLARSATGSDAGFVAIVGDDGVPRVHAETGLPEGFVAGLDLQPDTGIFDWAPAAEGGALLLRDFEAVVARGVRSILAVPLIEGDRPVGIFALVNLTSGGQFDVEALDLLAAFAEQARLMLGNAQLFDRFVDRYLGTLRGLATALDARRPWTHGHHPAVTRISEAVAVELGLDAATVDAVRTAAEIHDVGMAGLAGEAWSADVEHTAVATSLVEHLPLHPAIAPAIATHHEWYDGWGLPSGLRGDDIPIGGRIIGLAVVAAELLAGDPLRPPYSLRQVVDELERRAGSQFDPRVVAAATTVLPGLGLDRIMED